MSIRIGCVHHGFLSSIGDKLLKTVHQRGKNPVKTIKRLLKLGADVHCHTNDMRCYSVLHIVAYNAGNIAVAHLLLRRGADVQSKSGLGQSPLHCACLGGNHVKVAKLLLNHRAEVDDTDNTGSTPL